MLLIYKSVGLYVFDGKGASQYRNFPQRAKEVALYLALVLPVKGATKGNQKYFVLGIIIDIIRIEKLIVNEANYLFNILVVGYYDLIRQV